MNKKGGSNLLNSWVFGLVSIFGIGVIYFMATMIFNQFLVPKLTTIINASTIDAGTKLTIFAAYDKIVGFIDMMPYILFFMVFVYMVVVGIRKEGDSEYNRGV